VSNDAAEFLIGRFEFAYFAAMCMIGFPEHLEFLVALSDITLKLNVTLSSVFSYPRYLSGG
jgi:hypothetical protein